MSLLLPNEPLERVREVARYLVKVCNGGVDLFSKVLDPSDGVRNSRITSLKRGKRVRKGFAASSDLAKV